MLRVFSGSCMSLDDMDFVRPRIVQEPHQLGPGLEFFDDNGIPIRPQPSAHTMTKVFSGSALDLNDMNNDDDDGHNLPLSPKGNRQAIPTILGGAAAMSEKERERVAKSRTHVLVIGAGGYIGAHVVSLLLDAGYTVHCLVRDVLDRAVVRDLQALVPEATHRLFISDADITSRDALRDHVKMCSHIVHCGVSAATANGADVVEVHEAAIKALFDAIRVYGRASVKRVVLTGSAMAVCHPSDKPPASGAFDESSWNTTSTAKSDPLRYARVTFEKEAWRLREMVGVELVVILPSVVIGPSKTNETSEAMRTIHDLASGSRLFPFVPEMYWNFVDVRDVAQAHLRALETAGAAGKRYIVTAQCLSLAQIGRIIRAEFKHLHAPVYNAPLLLTLVVGPISNARVSMKYLWQNLSKKWELSSARARSELGVAPRPIEESVRDSVNELVQGGHLPATDDPRPLISPTGRAILLGVGTAMAAAAVAVVAYRRRR